MEYGSRVRRGMNRASWFTLLSCLFAAAVMLAVAAYGAPDAGLSTLALVFVILGLAVSLAVRGVGWIIAGFFGSGEAY